MGKLLTSKQKEYIRNCNHRWNIKEGAVRSGKTYMDLMFTIPYRVLNANPNGLIFIIGNTQGTLEKNILRPMREIYGQDMVGRIKPNGEITLFGKIAFALGADKITAVDRIHGSTVSYCYGDEVTTWNEEVFNEVKSRLSAPGACFDGTCNPDSPNHWFLHFLESEDLDIYRQKYLLSDNQENLDPGYYESIQLEYKNTVFYDRYILGNWTLAEGLVYQNYNPSIDAIDEVPEELNGNRYISCDYGTSNPCVFLLFEQGKSGTWYLTREHYYSGRDTGKQKTDWEYTEDFVQFACDSVSVDPSGINAVIVDPSAASFIAALRKVGFKVKKAKNDVLDGIRYTASMLNQGKIKILKSCKNTLKEFGEYHWDRNKMTDQPVKENDHCMDALRYFAYTVLARLERVKRSVGYFK